jgi:hypothetical protein
MAIYYLIHLKTRGNKAAFAVWDAANEEVDNGKFWFDKDAMQAIIDKYNTPKDWGLFLTYMKVKKSLCR